MTCARRKWRGVRRLIGRPAFQDLAAVQTGGDVQAEIDDWVVLLIAFISVYLGPEHPALFAVQAFGRNCAEVGIR